jgi:hypothetical protein
VLEPPQKGGRLVRAGKPESEEGLTPIFSPQETCSLKTLQDDKSNIISPTKKFAFQKGKGTVLVFMHFCTKVSPAI